jgi:hypothetical protein
MIEAVDCALGDLESWWGRVLGTDSGLGKASDHRQQPTWSSAKEYNHW